MPLDPILWPHLDTANPTVQTTEERKLSKPAPIVSANAYLGARGIFGALCAGADIVICGRVSDASPVVAAAWYWHSWSAEDYDQLAGALIAGHLIECSAYVTGANFSGFSGLPQDLFIDPGFPIAEIASDGTCIITKHLGTGGIVNIDTVKCQFLYELQGNVYLHSDCRAVLDDVMIELISKNRWVLKFLILRKYSSETRLTLFYRSVRVTGIRGRPPPPTTKVAIFYAGGYTSEILVNANGHGFFEKCTLFERQLRGLIASEDLEQLEVLEVQRHLQTTTHYRHRFLTNRETRIGVPATNPQDQNSDTMYIRIVATGRKAAVGAVLHAFSRISLKHFSG
jgi:hypothetical protein